MAEISVAPAARVLHGVLVFPVAVLLWSVAAQPAALGVPGCQCFPAVALAGVVLHAADAFVDSRRSIHSA